MPGRVWEKAFLVATDQYGFITHADIRRLGEDPVRLRQWLEHDQVERAGHGIYRFRQIPPTPLDPFMLATLWPRARGVISHASALELHALCDVNPAKIHLTVPIGFRLRRRGGERYVVHTEHLEPDQLTLHEGIRIVTPSQAIRQGIASGVQTQLLIQAIDTARRTGRAPAGALKRLEADLAGRS
jgi:predicted transcriptional regulator of viral defense system